MLALRSQDGTFLSNPDPATPLEAGSTVIVIGTQDQLLALEEHLHPDGGAGRRGR